MDRLGTDNYAIHAATRRSAMATVAATQQPSAFKPLLQKRHAPPKSSPLASSSSSGISVSVSPSSKNGIFAQPALRPLRTHSFQTSRPLRPFASMTSATTKTGKPVKIIEPPESFKTGIFVLNLTQAEFSRQE
ncbi:hypothetical protein EW145_g422 [Phellinidium pouzarii]|uniref:Uncharacterized protein n=1 Tax=Phellinidium pouzarii TaxID=167371 RepID=A0A4S4LIM6_9AGAM|nr:hypothetical protein EW145_g422 [Phellinidium pouzarii]